MADAQQDCPLCGKHANYFRRDTVQADTLDIECKRCGRFKITSEAQSELTPETRLLLSAFCRRAGDQSPSPLIKSTNINELINTLPRYGPLEKLNNLLLLLAEKTSQLGVKARFDSDIDYPLLICPVSEILFLTQALRDEQLISRKDGGDYLTMKGWERVQQIQKSGRDSKRAFVAMWFDASMDEIYDSAIAPAIKKAGYVPLRVDRHPHVNRIDDEIIGQIKRCRFMVADFSGQRHSVYFEAGMMGGLGRNVIWMCKKNELDQLKFDVRQFSFIPYESAEDAEKLLYNKILAIEGEGPVTRAGEN